MRLVGKTSCSKCGGYRTKIYDIKRGKLTTVIMPCLTCGKKTMYKREQIYNVRE